MDRELESNVFVERAFWVAAALAALGGVGPLLVGIGHTNRIGAVLFPFAAATVAMAALALFYRHGRSLSALVYFFGGLAIAYGLLLGLSVPMRLAVTGTCPPAPQICTNGYELQLTGPETTGLTLAVAFGIMSLFAGFVGLATLYRQGKAAPALPPVWPARPPESPPPPPPEPDAEPAPAPVAEPVVVAEPEPPPPPPPPVSAPVAEAMPEAKPKRKRRPKPPTG